MRRIHNPHTEPVKVVFGEPGRGVGYEIKAGETMDFTKEFYPVADHFLNVYRFLEEKEVETKEGNPELTCSRCGKILKSKAGKKAHERFCKVKPLTPVQKVEDKRSRSEKEDDDFIEMPEMVAGRESKEVIGGRTQKIVYDRDGIGWYGPGIENDTIPQSIRKPGQF